MGNPAKFRDLWFELHAQELSRRHKWPVAKARKVIAEAISAGAHGFWEQDPVAYWDWKRGRL